MQIISRFMNNNSDISNSIFIVFNPYHRMNRGYKKKQHPWRWKKLILHLYTFLFWKKNKLLRIQVRLSPRDGRTHHTFLKSRDHNFCREIFVDSNPRCITWLPAEIPNLTENDFSRNFITITASGIWLFVIKLALGRYLISTIQFFFNWTVILIEFRLLILNIGPKVVNSVVKTDFGRFWYHPF